MLRKISVSIDRELISVKHGLLCQRLSRTLINSFVFDSFDPRDEFGDVVGRQRQLLDTTTGDYYIKSFDRHGGYFCYEPFEENFRLENCDLSTADFLGALLEEDIFEKVDFTNADFRYANVQVTRFRECNLTGTKFIDADCLGSTFTGSDLTNADFTGANLTNVDFTGANLTNVDFTGSDLTNANFTGANLTGAILYDERGFRNGIHRNGTAYDDCGFDINKVHKNGTHYDDQGFALDGYNAQDYDRNGYDRNGFNQQGYDQDGYGRDGFNQIGFTRAGYGQDGNQYRVIKRNAPVYNRYEDDAYAVAVQKYLEIRGVPREKYCRYFFTDNLYIHVVYAGDTPNLENINVHDYQVIY